MKRTLSIASLLSPASSISCPAQSAVDTGFYRRFTLAAADTSSAYSQRRFRVQLLFPK